MRKEKQTIISVYGVWCMCASLNNTIKVPYQYTHLKLQQKKKEEKKNHPYEWYKTVREQVANGIGFGSTQQENTRE